MSLRALLLPPIVAASFLAASPAGAQGLQIQGYPAGAQVGGGAVTPVGTASGPVGFGWDVSVAGDVEFRPGLAIRAGYLYERFGVRETTVSSEGERAELRARTQMHVAGVDLVWRHRLPDRAADFYVFGGPLLAYRRVTLTSPAAGSAFDRVSVDVCEPHWLQCASTLPFHLVLGIRRSTDLGANAGAGVSVDIGLRARVFAEARFIYIDGPAFRDASGAARSADALFLPLVVGLRFQ